MSEKDKLCLKIHPEMNSSLEMIYDGEVEAALAAENDYTDWYL